MNAPAPDKRRAHRIDRQLYDKLVDAYRANPGNINAAKRFAGCGWDTARRAWDVGWPHLDLLPVRVLLEREQAAARARLHAEEQDRIAAMSASEKLDRERAAKHAVDSRVEEGQMVAVLRRSTIAASASLSPVIRGAVALGRKLERQLVDEDLTVNEAVKVFRQLATSMHALAGAGRLVMDMERNVLGGGATVVDEQGERVEGVGPDALASDGEIDLDAAVAEADEYAAILRRAHGRRLKLLQGGKEPPARPGGEEPTLDAAPELDEP